MNLKESDKVILQVAHLSIADCNYAMNRKVWEAFTLGIDYANLLVKEVTSEKHS